MSAQDDWTDRLQRAFDRVNDLATSLATAQAVLATMPGGNVLPDLYTVATLPAPADHMDKYARVTDLFGLKRDLVLASSVTVAGVTTAFWQPVRPDFASKITVTADTVLQALKSPSVLILNGGLPALGLTRMVTLSPALAFPGARFRIKNAMTGLGGLKIGNVNLGTALGVALGGSQEFVYDLTDGWVQIT